MKIQVLGTGCPKCEKLAEIVEGVAKDAGVKAEVIKVTDITEIMSFGVMMTPALVVNGEVKSTGRLPRPDEIKEWLQGGDK